MQSYKGYGMASGSASPPAAGKNSDKDSYSSGNMPIVSLLGAPDSPQKADLLKSAILTLIGSRVSTTMIKVK